MRNPSHIKLVLLLTILLLAFAFPSPAFAQGIVYGDTVPAGTTLDQDIVLIGQNVSINGTVNGNVIVLGNQVNVGGTINGSLVLIGQNIIIGGTVSGGTYAVGLTLELAPNAKLERDLYVISLGLASGGGSAIQRDLNAIGLDAGLKGNVGRNLNTAIGPIQLYNGLMRLLGFEELTLKLHFELPAPTPTQTPAPTPKKTPTPTGMLKPATAHARLRLSRVTEKTPFDWRTWGITLARDWVVLSMFGLLIFWLARNQLESTNKPLQVQAGKTLAIGLLVLVISVNLFVLAILLAALIFALGLALNYIGLWQLSIALWIAAYAFLALILVILWLFIMYGTKVLVIYAVFTWLFDRFSPALWLKVIALMVGTLVYVLLRSVPLVGWVIGVLVTASGMGAGWLSWRTERKLTTSETSQKKSRKKTKTVEND